MYPSASEILTAFTKNPDEGGKLLFERYYKPLVLFADSFLTDMHFSEDIYRMFSMISLNIVLTARSPRKLSPLICSGVYGIPA